jgi:hypothetical protein
VLLLKPLDRTNGHALGVIVVALRVLILLNAVCEEEKRQIPASQPSELCDLLVV